MRITVVGVPATHLSHLRSNDELPQCPLLV